MKSKIKTINKLKAYKRIWNILKNEIRTASKIEIDTQNALLIRINNLEKENLND